MIWYDSQQDCTRGLQNTFQRKCMDYKFEFWGGGGRFGLVKVIEIFPLPMKTFLIKISISQNEVVLSYHRVRGLYILAVILCGDYSL